MVPSMYLFVNFSTDSYIMFLVNKRVYHLTSFGKVIISSISLVESNMRIHSKLMLIATIVSPKELTRK